MGLQMGTQGLENLALDLLVFDGQFDDQIIVGKAFVIRDGGNALQRGIAIRFGDFA